MVTDDAARRNILIEMASQLKADWEEAVKDEPRRSQFQRAFVETYVAVANAAAIDEVTEVTLDMAHTLLQSAYDLLATSIREQAYAVEDRMSLMAGAVAWAAVSKLVHTVALDKTPVLPYPLPLGP